MRTALYIAVVITVATASPNGYYHQEYNYKTSASSYKNNELQHKTDDQGYYSRHGDLEGRVKPKVSSNSEHSEYVNPRLREQGSNAGYYDAGYDHLSHGNMLANTYGTSVGGQVSSGYQAGSQYDELASSDHIGGSSRYTGSYGSASEATYGSSNLRSIASNLQNDLQREIQSALISEAHRTDIAQLESELHRNLTERLNQILQERYGTQTIKGGLSYSLSGGRLETRPNYDQHELEQLQRQIERSLLEELRQGYTYRSSHSSQQTVNQRYEVTTTYRPTTYRAIYPNLNVISSQDKYSSYGQTKYGSSVDYSQAPNVASITTIASNVQRDLNNQLNRLLEQAQQQYFENSHSTVNTGAILEGLKQELRQNLTYALDRELEHNFGTQFQRNGYMFSYNRGGETNNQYNYNIVDLENLKKQVEENLITKLSRDFETARQHWVTRQQQQQRSQQTYYSQGQSNDYTYGGSSNSLRYEYSTPRYTDNDYYRPTSPSIVPLISSGVKGNNQYQSVSGSHLSTYEASGSNSIAQLQRQLQADLSNQLQAAISQNRAYVDRYSSGSSSFEEAYRRLYEELQRNLTQQLQSFGAGGSAYSGSYGAVSENQLAQLKSQLQSSLASQLQQGLQQSYSASASYSASSGSSASAGSGSYSSSNTGGYYRAARGSDNYQYGQYRAGEGYYTDDCQGDDPQAYQTRRSKRSYGYRSQPLGLATNTGAGYNSRGTYGGYSSYGGYRRYDQGQEEDDTEQIGQEIDDSDDTQQIEVDNGFLSGQGQSGRQELGQEVDDSDTQQHQISHGFGTIGLGSQKLQRGDIPQSASIGQNPVGQEEDDTDDTQQVEDRGFSSYSKPTTFQRQPLTNNGQNGQRISSYGHGNRNTYYKPTYGSYGQGQEKDDSDDTQQPEIDNSFGINLNNENTFGKPINQFNQISTPRSQYSYTNRISTTQKPRIQYGIGGSLPESETVLPLPNIDQPITPVQTSRNPSLIGPATGVQPTVQFKPATSVTPVLSSGGLTQPSAQPAAIPEKLTEVSLQLEESLNGEIENIVKHVLPSSLNPNQLYTETFNNLQTNITQQCRKLLTDKRYSYLNIQQQEADLLQKYIEAHLIQKLDQQFKTSTYFTYHPLPPKPYSTVVRRPYGQQNFGAASNTFLQGEITSQDNQYLDRPNQNNFRPVQFGPRPIYSQQDSPSTTEKDNSRAEYEADLLIEGLSKKIQGRNNTVVEESSNPYRPFKPGTNTYHHFNSYRPQYPLNPVGNSERPQTQTITNIVDNIEQTKPAVTGDTIQPQITEVKLEGLTPDQLRAINLVVREFSAAVDNTVQNVYVPTNLNEVSKNQHYQQSVRNLEETFKNKLNGSPSFNSLTEKFDFNKIPDVKKYIEIKLFKRIREQLKQLYSIQATGNSFSYPTFPSIGKTVPTTTKQVNNNLEPVTLENITPGQKIVIDKIQKDFSNDISIAVQNEYDSTKYTGYSSYELYRRSLQKLEDEIRRNLTEILEGKSTSNLQNPTYQLYTTLINRQFDNTKKTELLRYLEVKLIKQMRSQLRKVYNIEVTEDEVVDSPSPQSTIPLNIQNQGIRPSKNNIYDNQPTIFKPQYPLSPGTNLESPGEEDVIDAIIPTKPTVPKTPVANSQPQLIQVKLENITTDQLKAINQVVGEFSDAVDATVQNIYVPTNLNEYSKYQHYQQSVRNLEEEFKNKLRNSINERTPSYTSLTEKFEYNRIPDVQKYIEIKVIKRIREQLKKLYNIETTENVYPYPSVPSRPISTTHKPIYNTVERVVLENITPGQQNVINKIEEDFSDDISIAVQNEYDSNKYTGYSNYDLYKKSLQKLEEEIKRNLTEIVEGKSPYNLDNPTFKLYTTLINQQFESTKKSDLLRYLEIKLIKQVRTQLRKVYNIEVTEDSYEVIESSGPQSTFPKNQGIRPGSQTRQPIPQRGEKIIRLENITPDQLNIINNIQQDFSDIIKVAVQDEYTSRVSSSSPSYSNNELYKISLRKIEQEIRQNLSDIIEGGFTQNPTLQSYVNLVSQKFPQAKRSDLLQYLEIKLIKQVRSQLKVIYNIETTEDSYEVIESSGPQESNPPTHGVQERIVRLENITPEQLNIINNIQDDISDVINVAVQNEYDSSSFAQYSNYELYVKALNKLEQEIKKNLTEILNGSPNQNLQNPNFISYSSLIKQKFEPTKIPVLLQYLEIKLIKKIRAHLQKVYNIKITEDSYEVQETSGPQEQLSRRRIVRLENITPAQLQVIKKIEHDINSEIQNTLLLRIKTLKATSSGYTYQQSLDALELELKNKILELVQKLCEPGMSQYSELVSTHFDQTKLKNLEEYLEIRLVNELKESIVLNSFDSSGNSQSNFHHSNGSVRYSHGYTSYQSNGLNKQLDEDAEIVPSQETNLHLSPSQVDINSGIELGPEPEPTTEAGNWWSRFKSKVSKGATNIKTKITG